MIYVKPDIFMAGKFAYAYLLPMYVISILAQGYKRRLSHCNLNDMLININGARFPITLRSCDPMLDGLSSFDIGLL